jgi:hypothetical protein
LIFFRQSVRIPFLPQVHCGVALRWCARIIAALIPEGGIINPAGHEIVKVQKFGRVLYQFGIPVGIPDMVYFGQFIYHLW